MAYNQKLSKSYLDEISSITKTIVKKPRTKHKSLDFEQCKLNGMLNHVSSLLEISFSHNRSPKYNESQYDLKSVSKLPSDITNLYSKQIPVAYKKHETKNLANKVKLAIIMSESNKILDKSNRQHDSMSFTRNYKNNFISETLKNINIDIKDLQDEDKVQVPDPVPVPVIQFKKETSIKTIDELPLINLNKSSISNNMNYSSITNNDKILNVKNNSGVGSLLINDISRNNNSILDFNTNVFQSINEYDDIPNNNIDIPLKNPLKKINKQFVIRNDKAVMANLKLLKHLEFKQEFEKDGNKSYVRIHKGNYLNFRNPKINKELMNKSDKVEQLYNLNSVYLLKRYGNERIISNMRPDFLSEVNHQEIRSEIKKLHQLRVHGYPESEYKELKPKIAFCKRVKI